MFPYSALFGSTVGTCWASLFGNRDRYAQCKLCSKFFLDVGGCAILGSTVDT